MDSTDEEGSAIDTNRATVATAKATSGRGELQAAYKVLRNPFTSTGADVIKYYVLVTTPFRV